jgi:hypothetical protein
MYFQRLTNNKLARIPISRRGEVLLMCRFNMEASELDGVFKEGLTGGFTDKVLDTAHTEGKRQHGSRGVALYLSSNPLT